MARQKLRNTPLADLSSFSEMFTFLYCLLASNMVLKFPLIGGALYLLGRASVMYGRWLRPMSLRALNKRQKTIAYIILGVTLVIATLLIVALPIALDNTFFWLMMLLVFIVTQRPEIMRHYISADIIKGKKPVRVFGNMALTQLLFLALLSGVLFIFSPADTALYLLAGYAVITLFDMYAVWSTRYKVSLPIEIVKAEREMAKLHNVHAFRTFQNVLMLTSAALQATLIMGYTFIGCSGWEMLLCLGIGAVSTGLSYFAADMIINKTLFKRRLDPSNVLLVGLAVWLVGIILFSLNIVQQAALNAYLALALCTCGAGIAVRVLMAMENDMRAVTTFALGHAPGAEYDQALGFRVEFSALCGQLVALCGITLICMFNIGSFPGSFYALAENIRPLLVVPALLLVFAALFCALLFPMTKEHLDKLHKFLALNENGESNAALKQQLESVIIRRSLKHYGVKIVMAILRPLYYHKIIGRENVPNDPDVPKVFVCNHGEIYGPIVTNLYVPFSFRPWVIDAMMDKEAIAQSTANGTLTRFTWLPEKMRMPIARFVAPIIAWAMRSVDSIPVYYKDPRKLMGSFRESIAAMEAGDNILLFPENSDDTPDHRYQLGGVSHFYTGFTMLGQLYHNKTGKSAWFVPIYADRHKRTITFGVPTRYDAQNSANDEKERLCTYLRGEMLRIAGQASPAPHQTQIDA